MGRNQQVASLIGKIQGYQQLDEAVLEVRTHLDGQEIAKHNAEMRQRAALERELML